MACNQVVFAALLLVTLTSCRTESQWLDKTGCFKTKGCISFPSSCSSWEDCDYLVTYVTNGDHVTFQLSSRNDYAAFGLNSKKSMDGTDSIICSKTTTGGGLVGHYSVHHHNTPSISKPTPSGLSNMSASFENGRIKCRFDRSIRATAPLKYDLSNKNYLIYARGPVHESGRLKFHDWKGTSEYKQSLTSTRRVKQSNEVMIAIHAGLMLLAWIGFAPIGMFTARNMKLLLGNPTCSHLQLWFQLHRGCMMLTTTLTVGGIVVIFIYDDGWSKTAGWHAIIGIIVAFLATIQPLIALFRPRLDNCRRHIFNWVHRSIACAVFLLAVANCFLGTNLFNQAPLTSHLGFCLILSFIVGYLVLIIVYEAYSCWNNKQDSNTLLDNDHNSLTPRGDKDKTFKGNKAFDLVLYSLVIIIAVGVCATLISLVVVSTTKQLTG